jgi:leucyl aminopeptidase (aminopeptidase T)
MAYFLKMRTPNRYLYDLLECGEVLAQTCGSLKKGEHATILTDVDAIRSIPEVILAACHNIGAEAVVVTMSSRGIPMEVPKNAMSALRDSDVVFAATSKSVWVPSKLREEIKQAGARLLAMAMLTEDMARRVIRIDYKQLRERAERISRMMPETKLAKVTSKGGTNLTFNLKGQKPFYWDGVCEGRGDYDTIPGGYLDILPVDGSANGIAVLNGTWWSPKLGSDMIRTPIKVTVEKGWVKKIEGGGEAEEWIKNIEQADKNAKRFAEFAMGLNPNAAAQSGFLAEDEKHAGLTLVGLGGDTHLGGKVESKLHLDGTMLDATVELDGKLIVENGVLKL